MAKEKKIKEKKTIDDIIKEKYGDDKIYKISTSHTKYNPKDFISTGSRNLNELISGDSKIGIPIGKMIEIYGEEGTWKSTIALHINAEANKKNISVAYIDAEHAINPRYALDIGMDSKWTRIITPFCGEEAFDIAQDLLNDVGLIIFDSVDAMTPRAVMEGGMEEKHMGVAARMMGQGVRKLNGLIGKKRVAVVFINQMRMKIGVHFGDPRTTPGGKALKFYSFIRLETASPRGGKIEERLISKGKLADIIPPEDDEAEEEVKPKRGKKGKKKRFKKDKNKVEVGTELRIKSVKNKLYLPYKTCHLNMIYGAGIDKRDDLLRYFDKKGILTVKSKGYVTYPPGAKKSMLTGKFFDRLQDKSFKKELKQKLRKVEEDE